MHWGSARRATRDPDLKNQQAPPRAAGATGFSPSRSRVSGALARSLAERWDDTQGVNGGRGPGRMRAPPDR